MNRRTIIIMTAVVAAGLFAIGGLLYSPPSKEVAVAQPSSNEAPLVRPYSPSFGPADAPVTIVEFFDPDSVRVVLRYTAFHKGSDEAVRILETARLQGVFEPVLEAMLETQPKWAAHGNPNLGITWEAARAAGLDVEKARRDMLMPDITAILNQDMADVKNVGVQKTPTFFVNGKPLPSFGAEQLYKLVREEVESARNSKSN